MSFIPRNLLNEFYGYAVKEEVITEPNTPVDDDDDHLNETFASLSVEDVKATPAIASSLGKRKWDDTDMSAEESHQPYFEEVVQSHPAFIDYVHRYIHVIPAVELEDGEIVEDEDEDEEDTRMDVVEDGEIFEPKVGGGGRYICLTKTEEKFEE